LGKWLSADSEVLIVDHPTRGIDVGAKDEIYHHIRTLAKQGKSMIIMCDTLEEDIGLCNRMLILKDGKLVDEVSCPPDDKPTPADIIESIV
jgi:ribose transport system ATP-binding protein